MASSVEFRPTCATVVRSLFVLLSLVSVGRAVDTPQQRPDSRGGPNRIMVLDGSPVHDVGNLRVHASNWGAIGSRPGAGFSFSAAPSAEWPAGSSVEYLFEGGLWVAALSQGIPAVSTSSFEYEFRSSPDPADIVYRRALGAVGGRRIPNPLADDDADGQRDEDWLDGHDNDSDGFIDEDFAAISNQMFARRFRDDEPDASQIYPQHNPMHLFVREESYQWDDPDYDDFVGFTFWITNISVNTLTNVWVGLFADGDVGHRSTPNYWEDDATNYANVLVDHGPHGLQSYSYAFWYDQDGDLGQANARCGIVVLDHPTDPAGISAPADVGAATVNYFVGALPYAQGGLPTNDFERFDAMSNGQIEQGKSGDVRTLVAVGPFAQLAPNQTIKCSFALVVTPRTNFTNVINAAVAHHGLWFDLDGNPATGVDGKEHQENWYLSNDLTVAVAITSFDAVVVEGSVMLRAAFRSDLGVDAVNVYRGDEIDGTPMALVETKTGVFNDSFEYIDRGVMPGRGYRYQIGVVDGDGEFVSPVATVRVGALQSELDQNRPNPFNPVTTIRFVLPVREAATLAVYDTGGRRVRLLVNGVRGPGAHEVAWDGRDDDGHAVASGVYVYRLRAGSLNESRKMVLLK